MMCDHITIAKIETLDEQIVIAKYKQLISHCVGAELVSARYCAFWMVVSTHPGCSFGPARCSLAGTVQD